ncbi:hypothetical protein ABH940_006635 [Streptacidiphilus sp. BW17]|jgi:hypothetical protein|uniref:hypothetical protein n=1 Tax=Streptacidiphilus sp. BW17 TaxID=3156274 RepID=UPI0035192E33
MTWQTKTDPTVDEAFWDLVWSDPGLLAADLHDLAEEDLLLPPSDRAPGRPAPDGSPRRLPLSRAVTTAASGKVRSPPHTPERCRHTR